MVCWQPWLKESEAESCSCQKCCDLRFDLIWLLEIGRNSEQQKATA